MTDNLLIPEIETDSAKPQNLPEKFWDKDKQEIRLEALLSSYLELEKKLSGMMPSPETPEDRLRVLKVLGLPDTPDAYEVDVSHGLFPVDQDMNKRLHERGFTPDQVQMVYDLAVEKMVPMVLELADEFKAEREVDRLIAAFGGPEKWAEISRQLLAYGSKNLPPEVLDNLASSFEGVMALYRLMRGEEPVLSREDSQSAALEEGDLRSMMRDPRYWKTRDPSYVAKVTEGFRRMYAE
ncbi:MAG: capsid assembly protein [Micavibrio sp.]